MDKYLYREEVIAWMVFLSTVTVLCFVGFAFDVWYKRKQHSVYQKYPEDYLFHQ